MSPITQTLPLFKQSMVLRIKARSVNTGFGHTINRAYYVVRMYYLCMYGMAAAAGGMYDFSFAHKRLCLLAHSLSTHLTLYQKTKNNPILLPHCKQTPPPKRIIQPPPWRPPPASRPVIPSPRPSPLLCKRLQVLHSDACLRK